MVRPFNECVQNAFRSLNDVVYPFPGTIEDALGFVFELPDLRRDKEAGRKYVDGEDDEEEDEEDGDMGHATEQARKPSHGHAIL